MILIDSNSLLQILRKVCERESKILYIKDRNGRYIYANPIILNSFKLSEKDVFGKTDLEISQDATTRANHEEDLELISSKMFLTKAEFFLKIEICAGSIVAKELILDDSSEVLALYCCLQECNPIDPISQLAITNFERNHLLGIWVLNLYTFKFSISQGLAKILGIEPYASCTLPDYFELTDPEDKPHYEKYVVDAIQERKNFFIERKILNFLKEEKVLLESISAYPLDNYDLEHIYGIVLDITDSYAKKQEIEKRKLENEIQIKTQAKELTEAIQTKNKLLLKYQAFLNSLG
ncbi:MAG: PAS domain-containing protein, partial [Leptospiraceae bacterium]|nr:PAS domain-containing protein [Leptospiraceae bacterium]